VYKKAYQSNANYRKNTNPVLVLLGYVKNKIVHFVSF